MAEAFVNPYSAQVLKEALALKELENQPVAPMYSPEEVERRRANARYNAELATAMKLSGDAPLESLGGTMLRRALDASERRLTNQGELDPITGELKLFPEVQRQRDLERRRKELDRLESNEARAQSAYNEARLRAQERADEGRRREEFARPFKEAQAGLAAERTRRLQEEAARGKPLAGKPYAEMVQAGKDLDALDEVAESFKGYNPTTSISAAGKAMDWAARQAPGLVPRELVEQQKIWAQLQRIVEMKERHKNFGATLSGNERAAWETVTPPRGSSKDDMEKWISQQSRLLERAVLANAQALHQGGYSGEQIETLTRGRWNRPAGPPAAPPAPTAPTTPGRTRTYNPVTGEFD